MGIIIEGADVALFAGLRYHRMGSKRYVAFLRGVNVGGKSLIKMTALRKAVEEFGFRNVSTYLQSGNIIFESDLRTEDIASRLKSALTKSFGIEREIVLKAKEELDVILRKIPEEWVEEDDLRRYLAFAVEPKTADDVMKEIKPKRDVDFVKGWDGVIYMSTKMSGISRTGFSRLACKEIYNYITIRSYSTIQKIQGLMNKD